MRRRALLAAIAGAAIALPLSAGAQQRERTYRVGILSAGPPITPDNPLWAAFDQAIRKLGYAEHRNLHYERRFAQGKGRPAWRCC